MTLRLLRASDRVAQPWKNGGGVTREIAVHPPGAGFDDFGWRVSTAVVDASGPFSRFDGVDRVLVLLEGAGMRLAIGEAITALMTPESDPLPFPADVPVEATLPAGGITDLNIMVRRGRWTAQVERRDLDDRLKIRCRTQAALVFTLDACSLRNGPGQSLEAGDALLLEVGDAAELRTIRGRARLVMIELSATA